MHGTGEGRILYTCLAVWVFTQVHKRSEGRGEVLWAVAHEHVEGAACHKV